MAQLYPENSPNTEQLDKDVQAFIAQENQAISQEVRDERRRETVKIIQDSMWLTHMSEVLGPRQQVYDNALAALMDSNPVTFHHADVTDDESHYIPRETYAYAEWEYEKFRMNEEGKPDVRIRTVLRAALDTKMVQNELPEIPINQILGLWVKLDGNVNSTDSFRFHWDSHEVLGIKRNFFSRKFDGQEMHQTLTKLLIAHTGFISGIVGMRIIGDEQEKVYKQAQVFRQDHDPTMRPHFLTHSHAAAEVRQNMTMSDEEFNRPDRLAKALGAMPVAIYGLDKRLVTPGSLVTKAQNYAVMANILNIVADSTPLVTR
jgi:hypothetical protein